MGATCVNQAVKAVAIAKRDLAEEGTFLSCWPEFRDFHRNSMSLVLGKELKSPWLTSDVDLTVASSTTPTSTAGAIAGKIREGYKVSVRACGADAVSNAVTAVAYARQFLTDDGVDVYFAPEFEMEPVGQSGDERTVLVFRVCRASQRGSAE